MNLATKIIILPLLAIISAFVFIENPAEIKKDNPPNIIYILADDLGYGDISAFNANGKIKTPNIDNLAKEGMMFTDAHTSSSVCTPTRYGILTGRYNWRSTLKQGVLTGKSKALIPNNRTTIASMLKKQGYKTAFIGKWHLGWDWELKNKEDNSGEGWDAKDFDNIDFSKLVKNGPKDLGFDYSYGHSGSLDMAPYVYVENGKPTAIPVNITENKGKYSWWRKGPTSPDFVHEDVTPNFFRKAIGFVNENASKKKPFFLYLALPSPHTPILPTKEWQEKSGLNPYGDFIMMIDDYVGQLVSQIEKSEISNNTLIVFTSDNGCSPAAKIDELVAKGHQPSYIYRGHKADIFEGGHRVPFIVKWPTQIAVNSKSDQTICTTDFMATAAEITNYQLKDNEAEDSYSMLPLINGSFTGNIFREATVHHSINGSFAIRKGDFKLILCPDSGGWSYPKPGKDNEIIAKLPNMQLYNLKSDPNERFNLVNTNSKKVEELKNLLTNYILNGRSTSGAKQQNDTGNHWKQLWWLNNSYKMKKP